MSTRFSIGRHIPNFQAALCVLLILAINLTPSQTLSQPLAKGKNKFLGNAISTGLIWQNYTSYWNQVTPGNAGKWGSVEGSRDSYNWAPLDDIYNFALNNSYPFRYHNLVWGQQQPDWINALDSAGQRAQVEEWIRLAGQRYVSSSFVDVVNEPFHAVPSYANALGGSGKTGWDWVVTAFTWARQYFSHGVKLTLNDYSILQDNTVTSNFLRLVDTLRARGLVDAIGIQGHTFEFKGSGYTYSPSTLKANLQRLTATGLPVYITEFDINDANDSSQLASYQSYFPIFWEEPGVKGITFWGYMQNDMWQVNAYLVRSTGNERPALKWLRRYINTPIPPVPLSPSGTTGEPRNPLLKWHSSTFANSYHVQLSSSRNWTQLAVDSTVADTTFKVEPLAANTMYYWQVRAINDSGASSYSVTASFTTGDQIVAVKRSEVTPREFALSQNYPNPFNPTTQIEYSIPYSTHVSLHVYDLMGRIVAKLFDGVRQPGNFLASFDGSNCSSGIYICRLSAGAAIFSRKLILVK